MESLRVQVGRIRCATGGVVREAERAEGVPVKGEIACDEIDALLLAGLVEVLRTCSMSDGTHERDERMHLTSELDGRLHRL